VTLNRQLSLVRALLIGSVAALLFTAVFAPPALAATDVNGVLESIRTWVAGVLAALATLFLTIGGVRYLVANGNPRAVEEGKAAIKSALMGYGLAALAPMFIDILRRVLGA
jgi:type IV secretion system pilin